MGQFGKIELIKKIYDMTTVMISYDEAVQLVTSVDPTILMISKPACEPCRRIKADPSPIQAIGPHFAIFEIDFSNETEMDWILSFNVIRFPTFLYIQNRRVQDQITTGQMDQVIQWIHRNYAPRSLTDDF